MDTTIKNIKYIVFLGLSLILIIIGFVLCPDFNLLFEGFKIIIKHPSTMDFDTLKWAGNLGTGFINAGLNLFFTMLIYKGFEKDIFGLDVTAIMMMTGFSFYGKNILNIWFPIIGVFIFAYFIKKDLKKYIPVAIFSPAIAPIFNVLAFDTQALGPGSNYAVFIGAVFAILAGIIIASFISYFASIHKGLLMFNVGFAAGFASVIINSFLKAIGIAPLKYPYVEINTALIENIEPDYLYGYNKIISLILIIIFLYFIVIGIILKGNKNFKKILTADKTIGKNFIEEFGFASAMINLGCMGLFSTLYVILVGGQLCGPIIAAIFTTAGLGAFGANFKLYIPLMAGVFFMSLTTGGINNFLIGESFIEGAVYKVSTRGMILAAIFSAGVAPLVGEYGVFAGLFVGAMHSILVSNVAFLHGWMSLYNNAFSLGLITVFFTPIYSNLKSSKEKNLNTKIKNI